MQNKYKLKNHVGFQKYLKNTSWSMLEQIIRLFVNFFVGIWIIRYLGTEQYGVFAYVISFVSIFTIVSRLGLNNIIVKELVDNGEITQKLMNTAFSLKSFGALFIFILMVGVSFFVHHDYLMNLYIGIIGFGIIFQSLDVVEFYFQAKVRIKPIVIAKIIQLIISSLIKITLLLVNAELLLFVISALLDVVMISILYIFVYFRKEKSLLHFEYDILLIKKLISLGWPIALSNMVMMAYTRMDQIMLFNMMDASFVGIYAAATKLSQAWYFIPEIVTASLFPAILNARKNSNKVYMDRIQNLFSLMILISLLIAIPVTIYGQDIIDLIYGNAFTTGGVVLIIHIWVGLFISLGLAASRWFVAENLQKLFLVRTLTGLIINIVLNLMLIPVYGIAGAAIATLISVVFANLIAYTFTRKLWPLLFLTLKAFNLFGIYKFIRKM